MKVNRILVLTGIIASIIAPNVLASTHTVAYNKLQSIIAEVDPAKEGINYYVATDKNKNDWHGVYDNEGNIIAMVSTVYDRGDAEDIAKEFGNKDYYKVPMEYRVGSDFYQVIVPVYENTCVDVLCARPLDLYDDGYKVIKNWDMAEDVDAIVLRTNLTPSYMVRITVADKEGFVRWDNDWYPEEAVDEWNENMDIPLP